MRFLFIMKLFLYTHSYKLVLKEEFYQDGFNQDLNLSPKNHLLATTLKHFIYEGLFELQLEAYQYYLVRYRHQTDHDSL